MDDKLLSVDDLAEYLQLSTKTVYRLLREGELPCYRVGSQWRFRREAIDAWLEREGQVPEAADGAK